MAQFGWIDFSPKDRQRVGTILEFMKPSGQVDELGIGTIRDALADRLFPGISTIQTRAKYFFIIPYILQDFLRLSSSERAKKTPSKYLDDREHQIMWDLAEKFNHNERSGIGVIGISKRRGEPIVRRPSEIYWNGLNKFKCIDSKGLSSTAFLNNVNRSSLETLSHVIDDEDGGGDDADAGFENYFNVKVPVKENWQVDLDLELFYEEASFLQASMRDIENSMLSLLVSDTVIYNEFKVAKGFEDFAKYCVTQNLTDQLRADLILAHDFAEIMEGAHLAYNQELQKHFFHHDPFEEKWKEWYSNFKSRMIAPDKFDPQQLFVYTSPQKAGYFVNEWWRLINEPVLDEVRKSNLLRKQEVFAKGQKARIHNNRRTDVRENQQLGLGRLDYRFGNAKIIINDIYIGLGNTHD